MKNQGLLVLSLLLCFCCCTMAGAPRPGAKRPLYEDQYLIINGAKQFVSIRSKDVNQQPLLLFLHGGPGASATVLFQKKNKALENHFTVVCWDQRGAGRSFHAKMDQSTLTVPQLIADAQVLIDYLCKRFNRQKIFLVGHSWGSRLGMYLVRMYPEQIAGYIAVGQEVSAAEGERLSWEYTYKKAKELNNLPALTALEQMGAPQNGRYLSMYKTGFMGMVHQKEWLLKLGGERYGRTNYNDWIRQMLAGYKFNIASMVRWSKASASTASALFHDSAFNEFDLRTDIPAVQVPVHFVSGIADYNTPWPLVKEYAEKIQAPAKSFTLFDRSGHSPLFEEPQRFNEFVKEIFLKHQTVSSGISHQ